MKPFFTIFFLLNCIWAYPQGCIAIRNLVGFGQFARPEADPLTGEPTKWVLNINQRYFNAHQAFNGDTVMHEKPYLVKTTQLYVMDIGLSRFFENGWSFSVNLPISSGIRTAWNPENFNSDSTSHTTRAFGIGDLRITAYKWLWDVSSHYRWNIQVGLGLKLPTGDYRAQDYFYKDNTSKVLSPVNAVIQPGDGGTGIIAEINTYYTIQRTINLYGNLFYLFNPRDQNGTSNIYGNPKLSSVREQATATVNSVPDAYTIRLGGNLVHESFTYWLGGRMEGTPVHDIFGESNGQRRAGKIISIEPGVNYKIKRTIVYAFAPIPVFRQTKQTVPDQRIQTATSTPTPSPGGFANVLFFVGFMFRM